MKKKITIMFLLLMTLWLSSKTVDAQSEKEVYELASPTAQVVSFKEEVPISFTILLINSSYTNRGKTLSESQRIFSQFVDESFVSIKNHELAVISYNEDAQIISDFTNNSTKSMNAINSIICKGRTNLSSALKQAQIMFDNLPEDINKNILLITDRMPTIGDSQENGQYTSNDIYSYKYANAAHELALQLKHSGVKIKTFLYTDKVSSTTKEITQKFYENIQTDGLFLLESRRQNNIQFIFTKSDKLKEMISGIFNYNNNQTVFHYSDSYFKEDSTANLSYNPSLASMSLNLQLSSWPSKGQKDYSKKSENAKELFDKIGFEQVRVNSGYTIKPTKDSIGAIAAQKKIDDYTLVALSIRGGGYEAEWASNLTIGASGEHAGFNEASKKVLRFLQAYIEETKVNGKIKLWITGYSRAGAVANLLGGYLNNHLEALPEIKLEHENIYVFCFEPPAATLEEFGAKEKKHDNIVNIINDFDIVTKVAPTIQPFNFIRYGRQYYLPTPQNMGDILYPKLHKQMLSELTKIGYHQEYSIDQFEMKKFEFSLFKRNMLDKLIAKDEENDKTLFQFLDDFIENISLNAIKNRQYYTNELQDDFRTIFKLLGANEKFDGKIFFTQLFIDTSAQYFLNGAGGDLPYRPKAPQHVIFKDNIENALKVAGIKNYDEKELASVAKTLEIFFLDILFLKERNQLTTIIGNYPQMLQAHEPEICLAWLRIEDENYVG
ncbi:MAG: VWA domain-containing protein [Streptococcaceae bacterium]|jgi:uncharacterized protein YegL|nr:VWA domain-containing protein [Streptococcaceae bacterium]